LLSSSLLRLNKETYCNVRTETPGITSGLVTPCSDYLQREAQALKLTGGDLVEVEVHKIHLNSMSPEVRAALNVHGNYMKQIIAISLIDKVTIAHSLPNKYLHPQPR